MSFRDDLKDDLNIFVESEEFARYVNIDGVFLRAQVSTYTDEKSANRSLNFEGLHGDFVTLYFKTCDYCNKKQRLPRKGEQAWINGQRFDVDFCQDQDGIAKVTLATYRQNVLRPRPFRGANPYET